MKKPKKQKKPSYKSLAFDLAQAHGRNHQLDCSNQMLRDDIRHLKAENERLSGELDSARYVRENKMKQLGIYFAALNTAETLNDERLIRLQNELFDSPNYNPQDVALTKHKTSDLF